MIRAINVSICSMINVLIYSSARLVIQVNNYYLYSISFWLDEFIDNISGVFA